MLNPTDFDCKICRTTIYYGHKHGVMSWQIEKLEYTTEYPKGIIDVLKADYAFAMCASCAAKYQAMPDQGHAPCAQCRTTIPNGTPYGALIFNIESLNAHNNTAEVYYGETIYRLCQPCAQGYTTESVIKMLD